MKTNEEVSEIEIPSMMRQQTMQPTQDDKEEEINGDNFRLPRAMSDLKEEEKIIISITFPISMTDEKLTLTVNMTWTIAEVKMRILQEVKNIDLKMADPLTFDNTRLIFRAKTLKDLETMKNILGFKVSI
jgi:hypothetical protein